MDSQQRICQTLDVVAAELHRGVAVSADLLLRTIVDGGELCLLHLLPTVLEFHFKHCLSAGIDHIMGIVAQVMSLWHFFLVAMLACTQRWI
jgi:hypothetical protein